MASDTVLKTVRLPRALLDRLARQAAAENKDFSTVLREAVDRGLGADPGIDMTAALAGYIGRHAGSGRGFPAVMRNYGRPRHRR